jgi:glyoxylase I family protein
MEQVNGIGGLFFRARDPKTLAGWYEQHLGVRKTPESYEEDSWWQERGPTVFAPFEADTDYFGKAENQWMVNFRVSDLDAMTDQLVEAGIEVKVDPGVYPNGRFAHLADPEGNPIELWEPGGIDFEHRGEA